MIGKVEKGERWPSTGMPEVCDTVPDAGGVLARMAPLMHDLRLRETGLGMRKADTGVGAGRPFFSSRGRVILDVWTLRPERSKRSRRRGQRRIR